ncbi:MAG: helix-turn-helix transcriptional regulator [Mobilicoccus sp.]|nr:helix-turn-helix transcriptional regulator [Mobilicoccus sp.]
MTDSSSDHLARIGSRVREERRDQGLSVTALSHRSGIGRTTLSDLESAARTPTLETLAKIASGLGVAMPELLERRPPEALTRFEDDVVSAEALGLWVDEAGAQVETYRIRIDGSVRRDRGPRGARGYLTVVAGTVKAGAAATPRSVSVGGQLAYPADQPHVFAGSAEAVLVVRYPAD